MCKLKFLLKFHTVDLLLGSTVAVVIVVIHSLSHVRLFATPWTVTRQASLSITNSQSLLKFMSIESVMPSNSIFPSIRVFSNESALRKGWPKYKKCIW